MTPAVSTPALPSVNPPLLGASQAPVRGMKFAQMLDARRAETPSEPAPADKPKAEDTAAADNAQAARTADEARNRQLRASRQALTRAPVADGSPARIAPAPDEMDTAETSAQARDDTDAAADPTADASLADWLASLSASPLQPSSQTTIEPVAPADSRAAWAMDDAGGADHTAQLMSAIKSPAEERGVARRSAPATGGSETAQRQQHELNELDVARPDRHADLLPSSNMPAAFQAMLEQVALPVRGPAPAVTGEAPKMDLAGAMQAMSGAGPLSERLAPEAAAPTVVQMHTPADAPEFSKALGAQLSVFAKDGVQQAELHLNPADMGPISVQIALEGDQAKVDFGADSAVTRQIIENGLPELAAALRDAGFTLSGGGVHSQGQQQRQRDRDRDGGQPGQRPGAVAGGRNEPAPGQAAVRSVHAGGVDLYA